MTILLSYTDCEDLSVGTGSWQTVTFGTDTTYSLPANATGVILRVWNPGSTTYFRVRPYGDTDWGDPSASLNEVVAYGWSDFFVPVDASDRIQIYQSQTVTQIAFIGYFEEDARWLSAPEDVTTSTTASWQTVTCSTAQSGDLFAVVEMNVDIARGLYLRYAGSSTDLYKAAGSTSMAIIPLNGSYQFDMKIEHATECQVNVVGYITQGTIRTSGGSDICHNTTGSFENVTIPDTGNSYEIAILQVDDQSANTNDCFIAPDGEGGSYPDGGGLYAIIRGMEGTPLAKLSSDVFDANINDANIAIYCWGYLQEYVGGATATGIHNPFNRPFAGCLGGPL